MRYVVAVAQTRSFTQASRRCHVVQSALSHQIARLEKELGARLFQRTSRQVRLTAAGHSFVPIARQCLDAADRARNEVAATSGQLRGRLIVGVIPTVAAVDLPRTLRQFHQRHPEVRIGLRVGNSADMTTQVRHGELDIAFLGLPVTTLPKGVPSHELARDQLVAVMAPHHRLAPADSIALRDLTEEVFVDFPTGSAGRAQSDEAFAAAGLTREVAFEVTAADYMARLIREGLGVGMLPATYAPQLSDLVSVPLVDAPQRIEYLVWSHLGPAPAAAAFLGAVGVPEEAIAASAEKPSRAT